MDLDRAILARILVMTSAKIDNDDDSVSRGAKRENSQDKDRTNPRIPGSVSLLGARERK